jgi:hypothetical protein
MSYEPTLIIKYDDLKKIKDDLFVEQYSDNSDVKRIADYLLDCIRLDDLRYYPEFLGTRIVVCEPEFTSFNSLVRERLDEGGVYYVKSY